MFNIGNLALGIPNWEVLIAINHPQIMIIRYDQKLV